MAKKKGRVRVKQKAQVRKKGEGVPQMKTKRVIPDNGATFKVKIKKK